VSDASRSTVMYRLTVHCGGDDYFLHVTILLFRHSDLVKVKNQFGFHPPDIFSSIIDHLIQKSSGNFQSRIFLGSTFRFRSIGFVTQNESIDPSPRNGAGILNFAMVWKVYSCHWCTFFRLAPNPFENLDL
jgi:hypothetical protein